MKKWLYASIGIIFSIILLLLIAGAVFLTTNIGLKAGLNLAKPFIPGKFHYKSLEGKLTTGIKLNDFHYQLSGKTLTMNELIVKIDLMSIIHKKLTIEKLNINGIHYVFNQKITTKTKTTKAISFNWHPLTQWHLPIAIELNACNINHIIIDNGSRNGATLIKKIKWNLKINRQQLIVDDFYWQQDDYQIHGKGSVLLSDLTMHWQANITGQIKQHSVHGQLNIDGNSQYLKINANTNKPFDSHWQGSLHNWLTASGRINLKVNWKNINWAVNPSSKFLSHQGKLNLHGTFNNYTLVVNTEIKQQQIPLTKLQLHLVGNTKQIHLDNLKLNTLGGLIYITGHVELKPILKWKFIIDTKNIDPGLKWPEWSNNLNVTGILEGQKNDININLFSIPLTWINIHLDQLTIHGKRKPHTTELQITGQLKTKNGNLNFKGNTNFLPPFTTDLSINANKVLAINTPHYKITASTHNLKLTYKHPNLTISGKVDVPHANINLQDFTGIVTLPDNISYTNQKTNTATTNINLNLNLLINKLIFNYQGIYAELKGNLTLNKNPKKLMAATGQLKTTIGNYHAYGQKLSIDKGNLFFAGGPITNPGLNVRAIREIQRDIISKTTNSIIPTMVGINLTGTLKKTKVELFSKPNTLSQANILSYLLFGKGLGATSLDQNKQLLLTASSIGLARTGVLQSTRKALGLSVLGLESDEIISADNQKIEQNTSFVVGKKITSRLLVKYSIGLIKPVNVLNIIYQLNKYLQIRTDNSSIDNGIDVVYSIGKN